MIPKPMLLEENAATAVDGREGDGGDAEWDMVGDMDEDEEHLETALARLRARYAFESRGSFGRPDRS